MAFIQGQGTSNSSSSSSASTVGTSSQQQQVDAHKTNSNMDSESTPNLTHATRVSPATVRHRFITALQMFGRNENVFPFAGMGGVDFHFLFPLVFAIFITNSKRILTLRRQNIFPVSSLSHFTQQ